MSSLEWTIAYFIATVLLIGLWVVGEEDQTGRWVGFVGALLWPLVLIMIFAAAVSGIYRRWTNNRSH